MRKYIYIIILINLIFVSKVISQSYFNPVDTINFAPSSYIFDTYLKWIDFDNDEDLDLFLFSNYYARIYENTGNNNFVPINNYAINLVETNNLVFIDLGDFNNDGKIDILSRGHELYLNNGIVIYSVIDSNKIDSLMPFYNNIGSNYNNIYNYSATEIVFRNYYNKYYITKYTDSANYIIRDSFTVSSSPLQLGIIQENNYHENRTYNYDINKDGYFDIITVGSIAINKGLDSNSVFTYILRLVNGNYFYYGGRGDLHFADLDNDGYLDEISNSLSYYNSYNYAAKLSKNNQNSTLVEQFNTGIDTNFLPYQNLFDYNNDGKMDLLLVNSNYNNVIYKNFGNFYFAEDTNINNLGYRKYCTAAASADYNKDGDIDLAILFKDTITLQHFLVIYQNDSTSQNNMPTAPTTMWTTMDSTKIVFHWKPGSDVETPQATLSYNLMVGTTPNGIEIVSPLSDTATGFRRVVELGNAQLNDLFILDKSKFNNGDTLYWRVQTLDNSQGYSPFSPLQKTIVCNKIEEPVFDTICSNDSILWRGNYYSSDGRFKETYGTSSCDSTFFLDLTVNQSYFNQQSADICATETYYWNGQSYNQPGTYYANYTTTKGCDSVETLVLNVHHSVTNILDEQICVQDSFPIAGGFLNSSGFYTDSSQTAFGCDSLSLLTLTVSPSDTTVFKSNDTLFTTNFSAYKRWYNCETQTYVPNQNNSYFIPNQPGKYAAELTENGCSWMSECFDFTYLGIEDSENIDISVEPNPASNSIIIRSDVINKNSVIKIYSSDSKLILNQESDSKDKTKIDIESLASGVYFIKIINPDRLYSVKFVKE